MEIKAQKAENEAEMQIIFAIRKKVFVEEQKVPEDEEYDEYETTARHFLVTCDGVPCGTARWRFTDKGIKLERFAVLAEYRSKGIGSAVLKAVLADIEAFPNTKGKEMYMHSQTSAMGLYAKFGFQPIGEKFYECDIEHYKMKKILI